MALTNGMPTLSAGQGKAELTNPFSQCLARPQISTGLATSSPWKVSTASKHHLKETYLPSHLSGSKRNDFCCFKVKRGHTFVLAIIIRSIKWKKGRKNLYLTTMPCNQNNHGYWAFSFFFDCLKTFASCHFLKQQYELSQMKSVSPETSTATEPSQNNCKSNGFIPDPNNCQKFYQCLNGTLHTFSCPAGTLFDADMNVCNWASSAKCLWCK